MIHAIIDIGSNTVRMAVYQIKDGAVEQIMKKKDTTVGLASFVHDNVLEERGIKRLIYALEDFQKFLAALRIEDITLFATGALRNAANSREAVAAIKERTGLDIYVIRGEEEAELDFIGATHDLAAEAGLLFDIGGASTEMVHYEARKIVRKTSLPVGSLYLHTKFTKELLPSRTELGKMRADAARILDSAAGFAGLQGLPACGIGGTFKGAAALCASFFPASDGRTIRREEIKALLATAHSRKTTPSGSCAPFPTVCTRFCPASSSPTSSPNASPFPPSPTATRACARDTSTTAYGRNDEPPRRPRRDTDDGKKKQGIGRYGKHLGASEARELFERRSARRNAAPR